MRNREGARATPDTGEFRSGRDRLRSALLGAVSAGVLAIAATPALALWDDKVTPLAEEKATHDDNVFRVPTNANPVADTYSTTSLGLTLDVPVSRQRFQAGYSWNATRFNRLTDLDLDGHDARATWLWQLGNDLSGQLGYTETFALASFAYLQSTTPDPLKTRVAFLNAAYLFTPRWRVQGGVGEFRQTNGDSTLQGNDINITSANFGLSYVTPANTSVGFSERIEEGRFPNREFTPGSPFDDAYSQTTRSIVGDWTVTGVSHVTARAGRISRRYSHTPQSDFDGNVANVEYDWKPTGKFTLAGVLRRDISPFQDIQSSFVLVKGVTVRPTLSVTQKIDVSGILDYGTWYYLGDPGLVSGGTQGRVDRVFLASATVSYKPARIVTLTMTLQRESRSSNMNFDYVANVASAAVRVAF